MTNQYGTFELSQYFSRFPDFQRILVEIFNRKLFAVTKKKTFLPFRVTPNKVFNIYFPEEFLPH